MENLKEKISTKIKEIENMIKQNAEKSEIEVKRKELDDLLKQYTKEI